MSKVAATSPPSSFEPPSLSPTAHGVRVSPGCRWRSLASGFFLKKGDRNHKAKEKALRCVTGPGRPGFACSSASCGFCSHRCHGRRWRLPAGRGAQLSQHNPLPRGLFPTGSTSSTLCLFSGTNRGVAASPSAAPQGQLSATWDTGGKAPAGFSRRGGPCASAGRARGSTSPTGQSYSRDRWGSVLGNSREGRGGVQGSLCNLGTGAQGSLRNCSTSDSTCSSAEPWGWWLCSATCWGQDRDVTDRHGFGFYFPIQEQAKPSRVLVAPGSWVGRGCPARDEQQGAQSGSVGTANPAPAGAAGPRLQRSRAAPRTPLTPRSQPHRQASREQLRLLFSRLSPLTPRLPAAAPPHPASWSSPAPCGSPARSAGGCGT